jgi:predicted GNAT family acetyltransferase
LVRDQELYLLTRDAWLSRLSEPPAADFGGHVRQASPEDVHSIFWASARMHAEETLEDPLERNASHFRRHVEHRIENGRTYAWFDDHRRLLFKADVSAQSPWGAQISGVYTPPSLRGQGIATRAMYDVCDALFERGFPRVTLYVNRTNKAARRVYEKVGFGYHTDYQTVFVESVPRR